MHAQAYLALKSLARRSAYRADEADDLLQEALLAALAAGRHDLGLAANRGFVAGIIRNKARLMARSAARRRRREAQWLEARPGAAAGHERSEAFGPALAALRPSLRIVLALVLAGHDRREVAYLLGLADTALRQRIRALRVRLAELGLAVPDDLPGLTSDLAYGKLRQALLVSLARHGGVLASHDPDGHLFVIRRSQAR